MPTITSTRTALEIKIRMALARLSASFISNLAHVYPWRDLDNMSSRQIQHGDLGSHGDPSKTNARLLVVADLLGLSHENIRL